jgi:flagellar biosynthesis/type III secretory pathway chaperone
MTDLLQPLIEALREELQQYGEMLALLDREQELVMQRAGTDLFESVSAIQSQAAVIQQARADREKCRGAVAESLGYAADCPFGQLIPHLPPDYQPLVGALVRENNQLLVRVQQRARQNHLLLSRSLELMQRFLSTLFPSRDAQVYDVQGQRPSWTPPMHSVYEAVG